MAPEQRREIVRDAVGIGVASGAYALSFGALSVSAGLSVAQTSALSLLMFTGASQFALIGVLGAGGAWLAAAGSAILLGTRNALYGLRMAPLLGLTGGRRIAGSQIVIDESTAMAIAHEGTGNGPFAFTTTGLTLFAFWNLGTLLGALGARVIPSPESLGLDAAVPAAFIALLGPRLRRGEPLAIAGLGAAVALALTPVLPIGVPIIASAMVAVAAGIRRRG